jgi:hypothetical protein
VKVGGFVNSILALSVGGRATENVLRLSEQECLSSAFMMTGDTFCVGQAEHSNCRVPSHSMHFSVVTGACFDTMSKSAGSICQALADHRDYSNGRSCSAPGFHRPLTRQHRVSHIPTCPRTLRASLLNCFANHSHEQSNRRLSTSPRTLPPLSR